MADGPPMLEARAPSAVPSPPVVTDPDVVGGYLEDASGAPKGTAAGLVRPASEAEAAAFLRATLASGVRILPQAARTSLTAGAIPEGEVVVSVERLRGIGAVRTAGRGGRVEVDAGVRLRELQAALRGRGFYYPPVPTYQEAMIGGTVSTNAGGSATFKYGVTRQWVRGLRVVLWNGDVLEVERGQAVAPRGGRFRIGLSDGAAIEVPAPDYALPELKKISAGYFAADPLDLVDLLVGSEGTLVLVTRVTLDVVPLPPAVVTGLAFVAGSGEAVRLAGALRAAAAAARRAGDDRGPDVRSIEFVDDRALGLLREHGDAARLRVDVPAEAGAAVLFEVELSERTSDAGALDLLERVLDDPGAAPDLPLTRLFAILAEHGAVDALQVALPEDESRREALIELREAVPKRVNEILAARRRADPAVRKVGGDPIVPFERVPELLDTCTRAFRSRGLASATWGHLSDGNLHPNVLASTAEEVERGEDALLEIAARAAGLGGSPLSEHGVGRHPLKQEMLRRFLGDDALACMRRVKRALDPPGRLAPGVLFRLA